MAKTKEQLRDLLSRTKFRHSFIGVNEEDAWRVVKRLSDEYEELIMKEKECKDAIIEQYVEANKILNEENTKLKLVVKLLKANNNAKE